MYFFIGLVLVSFGSIFFILYLNLLNMGYSFFDYLLYCFTKLECFIVVPGILILYFKYIK